MTMDAEHDFGSRITLDVDEAAVVDGYRPVHLQTHRGAVALRFYEAEGDGAVVWVGGAGGGWDTPAQGLYPRLCRELVDEGIGSLRVRFRHPHVLNEAVHDVRAGLSYLHGKGYTRFGLTGHSFGGAVVVQAAALVPEVCTVVALATQSYGADPVAQLGPRCSVLLLHGTADTVLPPVCSQYVYDRAREPRRIQLFPGAGHVLDEPAAEVYRVVRAWIVEQMT